MEIALTSHVEQFILRLSPLLVLVGGVGFLVARRWPRSRWLSAVALAGLVTLQARHFVPPSEWAEESRTAVWHMLAILLGAGVAGLCLVFLGARRRE